MADKMRSATVTLCFAPLDHSPFAFQLLFSNQGKPQALKRGGMVDSPSNCKHAIGGQLKNGMLVRILAKTVVEALLSAIGVHHNIKHNVHYTCENTFSALYSSE